MRMAGRSALLVALACASLAACSGDGDEEPVTLPTTTASSPSVEPSTPALTTASAEPTPTTTLVLPDEHVESAEVAARGFFTELNQAKDSHDFSAFDALYLERCEYCLEMRAQLQALIANASVEGGDWVIVQISSSELADGTKANVNVFAYQTALRSTGGDGSNEEIPSTAIDWFQMGLLGGEPWVVEDVGSTQLEQ